MIYWHPYLKLSKLTIRAEVSLKMSGPKPKIQKKSSFLEPEPVPKPIARLRSGSSTGKGLVVSVDTIPT